MRVPVPGIRSFAALFGEVNVSGANLMIEAADHKPLVILDGMNQADGIPLVPYGYRAR
jgi:hypothetical protein